MLRLLSSEYNIFLFSLSKIEWTMILSVKDAAATECMIIICYNKSRDVICKKLYIIYSVIYYYIYVNGNKKGVTFKLLKADEKPSETTFC